MKRTIATATALAAMLAVGTIPSAQATPAATQENVSLVTTVPGSTGGHSVVVGNRLYVGAYGLGMRIFNISNPRNPVPIGEYFPGPQGADDPGLRADAVPDAAIWDGRHIATLNGTNRAAATQQTEFLDVTDPEDPVLLHRFTGASDGEAHNGDIARERRLWLPSGGSSGNGLRIYDMSPLLEDPPQPPVNLFRGNPHSLWAESQYREFMEAPTGSPFNHTHDLEIYEDLELLLPPWEWETDEEGTPVPTWGTKDIVLLAASTGYALDGPGANDGAAYIIDITDPENPEVINKWQNPPANSNMIRYFHEVQFLDGDRNTMVVADEDLHNGCESGRLYTVSVSDDLMQAEKLAEWAIGSAQADTPTCAGSHVFSSNDRYVFMGAYTAGLQVLDLRDPANPVRVGRYIPEGANSWGALYHEGVIYVGDFGVRGLDVLEFIPEPDGKAFLKGGHPGSSLIGGASELTAGCNEGAATNEIDGFLLPIPQELRTSENHIRLWGSAEVPPELTIWFYDEGCDLMDLTARGSGDPILDGAAFAWINMFAGTPQWVYAKFNA